jgi:signal peptidase I
MSLPYFRGGGFGPKVIAGLLVILAATLWICRPFFITIVTSNSMEPTFKRGDKVITTRLYSSLSSGDVIVIKTPEGEELVKRIAFMGGDVFYLVPGDDVNMSDVIVSEHDLKLALQLFPSIIKVTLDDGYVYVIGDNESNSIDSRTFGPLPLKNVLGKVL